MLAQFLPLGGDRVMVKDFCRQLQTKSAVSGLTTSRRDKLVKRIRQRLDLGRRQKDKDEASSSSDDDAEERSRKNFGNLNATRPNRQIEIGWLCKSKGVLKQVRQKQGGGTRKVAVPKTYKKMDILSLAKDLFFPSGISSHGPATQFQFDVWNFKHQPMDGSVTVAEVYESSKLPLARFYLVSQPSPLPPVDESVECAAATDRQRTVEQCRYISSGDEEGLPSIPTDGNKCLRKEKWHCQF